MFADTTSGLIGATWALVIVTGCVVLVTAYMAWKTKGAAEATSKAAKATARAADAAEQDLKYSQELVRATREQAEAARAALMVARQPELIYAYPSSAPQSILAIPSIALNFDGENVIIQYDRGVILTRDQQGVPWLAIPMRNVGAGTAHIGTIGGDILAKSMYGQQLVGRATSNVVAPDQLSTVYFRDFAAQAARALEPFVNGYEGPGIITLNVMVHYFDLARTKSYRCHLTFVSRRANALDLTEQSVDEEILGAGPAAID